MERRHAQAGGVLVLVLVAIVALTGAGAWNYRRNLAAEQQRAAARPLHGYSTSDLEALADAYRHEIAAHPGGAQKQTRAVAKDRAYFDEQVQEFEKVQKQAAAQRKAGATAKVGDVDLQRVEEELRARGGAESELDRHLRLLLTF